MGLVWEDPRTGVGRTGGLVLGGYLQVPARKKNIGMAELVWDSYGRKGLGESSEAPARKKTIRTSRGQELKEFRVQSSELGPWGSIQPNVMKSGGQEVQDLGPWSTSTGQPNIVESGSQCVQALGPWSAALLTTAKA